MEFFLEVDSNIRNHYDNWELQEIEEIKQGIIYNRIEKLIEAQGEECLNPSNDYVQKYLKEKYKWNQE